MNATFIVSDRDASRLSQLSACSLGNNGESWYIWFRQGSHWYFVCHHGRKYRQQDSEFPKDYERRIMSQIRRHPGAILICCYPNKICKTLRSMHLFPDGKGEVVAHFDRFGRGLWAVTFRCKSRNAARK